MRRLAAGSDILVENFRPGTAARLGLGYDELARQNAGLIYASISGYGQTGPSAGLPGYDAVAQAMSGMMSVTGEPDGEHAPRRGQGNPGGRYRRAFAGAIPGPGHRRRG